MTLEYWADPCARCGGLIQSEKRDDLEGVLLPSTCQATDACRAGRAPWDGRVECGEDKPADGVFTLQNGAAGAASAATLAHCIAVSCEAEIPQGRDWCSRHFAMIPRNLRLLIYHAKTRSERELAQQKAKDAVEQLEFGKRLL